MPKSTLSKRKLVWTLQAAILFVLPSSLAMGQEIPAWEGFKAGTSTFFGGLRRLNPGYMLDVYRGIHGIEAQVQLQQAMVERHMALQESYATNPAGSLLLDSIVSPYYSVLTGRDMAFGNDLSASEYLMSASNVLLSSAGQLSAARSATGFNPRWTRNHAGEISYSHRVLSTARKQAQVNTGRPYRRFRPEFEELELRSELSANHSEILTPWRSPRQFSSKDYITMDDLKGAQIGKFIGQGTYNFVFHVENLKVADTSLVLRVAKAPQHPSSFTKPNPGYLAGIYAIADRQYPFFHPMAKRYTLTNISHEPTYPIFDKRAAGDLYGYLDFYRGEQTWLRYYKNGVTPSVAQWELLVDQLYHSGRRGFHIQDLHLNNIVEGYIVDFMSNAINPIDAWRANLNAYKKIVKDMGLDTMPVPFPELN